jgi:alpha-tubulin suppressor-like RCC1 family protein
VPTPVSGGLTFASVSAGSNHTCAVTLEGTAYCWGLGEDGQLGNGSTDDRPVPTAVGGEFVLAAGPFPPRNRVPPEG